MPVVNDAPEQLVRAAALPLTGATSDLDVIINNLVNDEVRVVLLGESSHGTSDFYRLRAAITKRLIREKGFTKVAVEADWPDAYEVDRFVRNRHTSAEDAEEALKSFHRRFPTWMWRNADVLDFVGWMREYNSSLVPTIDPVDFFGLDVYSLCESIHEVVAFLDKVDKEAADRARRRYTCFEIVNRQDPQMYGMLVHMGIISPCEQVALNQLTEMRKLKISKYNHGEHFSATQNARLVVDAEHYYRVMFAGTGHESWNVRDTHMTDTVSELLNVPNCVTGTPPKVIVWAHNSHVGDARATEMGWRGEVNIGQLCRERFGKEHVVNLGFTTHHGTVAAASFWDAPVHRMNVKDSLPQSYERLFHDSGLSRFVLVLNPNTPDENDEKHAARLKAIKMLRTTRLERAIGVIYRPDTERQSHYFQACLPDQFDAVIHIDRTRAVEPLEKVAEMDEASPPVPDTFPFGV